MRFSKFNSLIDSMLNAILLKRYKFFLLDMQIE